MHNSLTRTFAPMFLFAALAPAQYLGYPTPEFLKRPTANRISGSRAANRGRQARLLGNVGMGNPAALRGRCGDTQISREFINIAATLQGGLPLQPWAAELMKQRSAEQVLDPNVHCMPRGAPRIWTDDYYKRIFMLPGVAMIILTERNIQYRQIFMDGRPLPADPNPTWNGYSTAKWDGDTLVVETTGFKDGLWLDANGDPLSRRRQDDRTNPPSQLRDSPNRSHDRRSQVLHEAVDRHDE